MRILRRIKRKREEVFSTYVFGLGNPGPEYAGTLHNAGFMALDHLAEKSGVAFTGFRGNTLFAILDLEGGKKVLLGKPQTYMNLSGASLRYFVRRKGASLSEIVVVHDDMDVSPGKVKLKRGGGPGGHRGVESIISKLGSDNFTRIKIGVGRPFNVVDPSEYVLAGPMPEIREEFYSGISHASDAIITYLNDGAEKAFTYFNSNAPYERD